MSIKTLTVNECCGVMREHGLKISSPILELGIEQGVFPFAVCIKSFERKFFIFEKQLLEWLKERAEGV